TVSDGVLNIAFGHVVENPLVNAIEVLGAQSVGGGSSSARSSGNSEPILALQTDALLDDNLIVNDEVRIYPNPASIELYITTSRSSSNLEDISLYDFSGRLIKSRNAEKIKVANGSYRLSLIGLENGTYVLKTTNVKGVVKMQKIVVNN
uniref:T9SS type A sorting domain-containing protein n=1 Tax=Eudoraea algarum TaxID=3417568 RepID=UPI003D360395